MYVEPCNFYGILIRKTYKFQRNLSKMFLSDKKNVFFKITNVWKSSE